MNLKVLTLNIMSILSFISVFKTEVTLAQNFVQANEDKPKDINLIGHRKFLTGTHNDKKLNTTNRDLKKNIRGKLLSLEDDLTSNVSNATTKKTITLTTKINDTQTKNIKRASEYTSEQTTFINALPFSTIKYKRRSLSEQKDKTSIDLVSHYSRYDNGGQDYFHFTTTSNRNKWESSNTRESYQNEDAIHRHKDAKNNDTATRRSSTSNTVVGNGEIYTSATYLTYKAYELIQKNITTRSSVVEKSTVYGFPNSLNQNEVTTKSMDKNYTDDWRWMDSSNNRLSLESLSNISVASKMRRHKNTNNGYRKYHDPRRSKDVETNVGIGSNMTLNKKSSIYHQTRYYLEPNRLTTKFSAAFRKFVIRNIKLSSATKSIRMVLNITTIEASTIANINDNAPSNIAADKRIKCQSMFCSNWFINERYLDK